MMFHIIYIPEIPLPDQKSITHRRILILQIVNKISIRSTSKLLMGLSKVFVNQEVPTDSFVINEVNLLFYIIRRNSPHKAWRKSALPSTRFQKNEK